MYQQLFRHRRQAQRAQRRQEQQRYLCTGRLAPYIDLINNNIGRIICVQPDAYLLNSYALLRGGGRRAGIYNSHTLLRGGGRPLAAQSQEK